MSGATLTAAELVGCREASVVYGHGEAAVHALASVDVSIDEGDAVAFRGPSGSGKTTLLHLLGGLLAPSAGEVLWRGRSLASLDAAARGEGRAREIAFVFQGSNLLPTFTAFENVAFAAWVARRAEQKPAPAELLELVGLAAKLDALPAELSGGEQQRVAIARALASSPTLLLCDEPTGHLDSDTARRVLDLVEALRERFGFALAIATHDRDVADRCPRLLELADGRIIEEEAR